MMGKRPKRYSFRFWAIVAISFLLGGLLVFVSIRLQIHASLRFLMLISAAYLLTNGVITFLMFLLQKKQEKKHDAYHFGNFKRHHNFFLYDATTKKDIPEEKMDAHLVFTKTLSFMGLFVKHHDLQLQELLDAGEKSVVPPVMRPLVVWSMLYQLTAMDDENSWRSFLSCGKPMADAVATVMPEEEDKLVRKLQNAIAHYGTNGDYQTYRSYLMDHRTELEEKMLSYARAHLHEFDNAV